MGSEGFKHEKNCFEIFNNTLLTNDKPSSEVHRDEEFIYFLQLKSIQIGKER